jgi:serine/threonine-protein kinase
LLEGLHAAHEARGPGGRPLDVVHRDVSPQNILVGIDGLARVVDFGIAKAASQLHETTAGGAHKGKIRYMAPEQLDGRAADRRADIWAAGVVLWELLALRRLFAANSDGATVRNVMEMPIPSVSSVFDRVLGGALSRDPALRYADARTMALALEAACPPASSREISAWVGELAAPALTERQRIVDELETVAKAGMPSVRTQLAVITERASRNKGPLVPPRSARPPPPAPTAPTAEEATQPFGGRPFVSTPPPAPMAKSRAGIVIALGVAFVLAIALVLGWHFLGVRI